MRAPKPKVNGVKRKPSVFISAATATVTTGASAISPVKRQKVNLEHCVMRSSGDGPVVCVCESCALPRQSIKNARCV
jgi:hypothetical protein